MYDELVKRLRASVDGRYEKCDVCPYEEDYPCCVDCLDKMHKQAADTIEELSAKVENLQFFTDNISKLPGCNTCLKKNLCEFRPKYGEYCRINCPAWLGLPPKEET